jgi:hypothetical protein
MCGGTDLPAIIRTDATAATHEGQRQRNRRRARDGDVYCRRTQARVGESHGRYPVPTLLWLLYGTALAAGWVLAGVSVVDLGRGSWTFVLVLAAYIWWVCEERRKHRERDEL